MHQGPGRSDPWAGFARGEDHEHHDPVQARFETYRGLFWTHVQIGVWWVPVVTAICLVAVVASLALGSVIVTLVVLVPSVLFVLGADQATPDWTREHNLRVAAALRREKEAMQQAEADDLAWRVPPVTG